MNVFHISDVDLLEQIHDSATVRLAPNDAESATIMCDTDVAQVIITFPQLLNIFIDTLIRVLTLIGRIRLSAMVCRLARTRRKAVKTPTPAISLLKYVLIDYVSIF